MPNLRLPLLKKDSTGDIQVLSGYVTALRIYPFTSNANAILGTEAAEALGYYDYEDVEANVAYQKWYGTSLETMIQDYSFSGDDGKQLFGTGDETLLNADDFTDYQIPALNPNTGLLEPMSLADLMVVENINALPYYAYTNVFYQDNSISSGKIRVGIIVIQNTVSGGTSLSLSSKTGTGIYMLQFRTVINGVTENSFIPDIANSSFFGAQWERVEKTVLNSDGDIIGKVIFGTNFRSGDFDLGEGRIEIRTYDADGNLADDILTDGITASLKAYKQA